MQSTLIKMPVVSFRRIESPFDDTVARTYIAVLSVADLPEEFEKWRKLNPRDPKPNSGVSKKIKRTLEENPDAFFFRNRGITLLVEKASFDNQTSTASLELTDLTRHGLLDGGHTYRVIRDYVGATGEGERSELSACVRVEIIEGITNLDEAVEIVHARNTSAQVQAQGLEELLQHFEPIKQVLKGKAYEDRIAYKEYELDSKGEAKDIDIKEILSYLVCFDSEAFDGKRHPILAYSQKSEVIEHFKKNRDRLQKYIPLLPRILELRDEIYLRMPEAAKKEGIHFGNLTGVIYTTNRTKMSKEELPFTGRESSYRIPSAFIYPTLAAFRNLVRIKGNKCEWKDDPIRMYEILEKDLAVRVSDQAKEMRNPTKLGKDQATWGRCYDLVELETLRRELK